MKKISLLLMSVIVVVLCYSQDASYKAHKYRAYKTKSGDNGSWEPKNILVVINPEKEKIHIFGQQETDLSILYKEEAIQKTDGMATFFRAVDQDGESLDVMIKMFTSDGTPDENVALLVLVYKEGSLFLSLKND